MSQERKIKGLQTLQLAAHSIASVKKKKKTDEQEEQLHNPTRLYHYQDEALHVRGVAWCDLTHARGKTSLLTHFTGVTEA